MEQVSWCFMPNGYNPDVDSIWHTKALDALSKAKGPIVFRRTNCDTDNRSVLEVADAETPLHEFICWYAERQLKYVEAHDSTVDQRSWNAIETKRRWVKGEETDDELWSTWESAAEARRIAETKAAEVWEMVNAEAKRRNDNMPYWAPDLVWKSKMAVWAARDAEHAAMGWRQAIGAKASAARIGKYTEYNLELERRLNELLSPNPHA